MLLHSSGSPGLREMKIYTQANDRQRSEVGIDNEAFPDYLSGAPAGCPTHPSLGYDDPLSNPPRATRLEGNHNVFQSVRDLNMEVTLLVRLTYDASS